MGQNPTDSVLTLENSTQVHSSCFAVPSPSSGCSSSSGSSDRNCSEKTTILSISSDIPQPELERHHHAPPSASMTPLDHNANDIWQLMNTPVRGRQVRRRCISCVEGSQRARTLFSSPDRFVSPRLDSTERESVFRVSKSPHSLSPRERKTRERDASADPFRSTNPSRSRDAVRIRRSSVNGRHRAPHFTPSFVYGHDASPGPVDANDTPIIPRQISVGAVWNVGGPAIAQGGPRPAVQDGHGGLLASGTNGPMHTAHFLDSKNPNQDIQQHEDRLAVALGIDQASRVLSSISRPPLVQSASTDSLQSRPFSWRNNSWTKEEGAERTSIWLPSLQSAC